MLPFDADQTRFCGRNDWNGCHQMPVWEDDYKNLDKPVDYNPSKNYDLMYLDDDDYHEYYDDRTAESKVQFEKTPWKK